MGQIEIMWHMTGCMGRMQHHFCEVSAKGSNPIFIRTKHQQPKLRERLQNNRPAVSESGEVKVVKVKLKNWPRLERVKTHDKQMKHRMLNWSLLL